VLYLDAQFLQGMIILRRRLCLSRSTTLQRRSHLDVLTDEQNPFAQVRLEILAQFGPQTGQSCSRRSPRVLPGTGNISRLKFSAAHDSARSLGTVLSSPRASRPGLEPTELSFRVPNFFHRTLRFPHVLLAGAVCSVPPCAKLLGSPEQRRLRR
jgi:hypothetical protein